MKHVLVYCVVAAVCLSTFNLSSYANISGAASRALMQLTKDVERYGKTSWQALDSWATAVDELGKDGVRGIYATEDELRHVMKAAERETQKERLERLKITCNETCQNRILKMLNPAHKFKPHVGEMYDVPLVGNPKNKALP